MAKPKLKSRAIYTRHGDKGYTCMVGNQKVSKAHKRVVTYGTVDELNSILGLVVHALKDLNFCELIDWCFRIQNQLLNLGSALALNEIASLGEREVRQLELEIDKMSEKIPPLDTFILPGGSEVGARLHVARTVCRRLEVNLIMLLEQEKNISESILAFVNRLSDWLFVAARFVNFLLKEEEQKWQKDV